MVLARSVAPGAFRNGCKSNHEARSGCREEQQPRGCRSPGERCPRIPRRAGLCSAARSPEGISGTGSLKATPCPRLQGPRPSARK